MKTRGGDVRPYKIKWGHWRPVCGQYRTKGGHRDLIMSPKGFHSAPVSGPGNPMGINSHLFSCEATL